MNKLEEALKLQIESLKIKFKKRTIAYGIQKKKAILLEKDLLLVNRINKLLSRSINKLLKDLLNMDTIKSTNIIRSLLNTSPESVQLCMKHLDAEDSFTIMKLLQNPKYINEKNMKKEYIIE